MCTRHVCLQLRWIPSTVRESRCHLMIGWTSPGSLCLGKHSLKWTHQNCSGAQRHECVCLCSFPPASASYILLQFAQYGNILKHTVRKCEGIALKSRSSCRSNLCGNALWQMASPGNWMHLQYQSKLQARKALSKDGKVFGDTIMVGVKPCIDKVSVFCVQCVLLCLWPSLSCDVSFFSHHFACQSVMDSSPTVSSPHCSSSTIQHFTSRSTIRPLSASYRSSSSDYQVEEDSV